MKTCLYKKADEGFTAIVDGKEYTFEGCVVFSEEDLKAKLKAGFSESPTEALKASIKPKKKPKKKTEESE